jgi:hypothetical protein
LSQNRCVGLFNTGHMNGARAMTALIPRASARIRSGGNPSCG